MNYNKLTKKELIDLLELKESKPIVMDSYDVIEELREFLLRTKPDFSIENMGVVVLDAKNKVIGIKILFTGDVDRAHIYPRQIFKYVFQNDRCKSFILWHNHPSGNLKYSKEDEQINEKISALAEQLSYNYYDHLIIDDFALNYKSIIN